MFAGKWLADRNSYRGISALVAVPAPRPVAYKISAVATT